MIKTVSKNLIAPCGMNCGVCRAHLRDQKEQNFCPGCRSDAIYKSCLKCIIRKCPERKGEYCDCDHLPCRRLKQLDARYRNKYDMSMLENLKEIEQSGIGLFVEKQNKKYVFDDGVFCVHDKKHYPGS